ncbi:MAG: NYN domain-containing protein, partial [Nanoarchaeota archaeon]|nr:NYN domain-containing protein [Nanoarchaeota archaeon]
IFQKGVDVQLASDLVDFTHKNVFDVAVILSGDIDLLESIKIAKGMGKQVVIVGDRSVTAEEMKKIADLYADIGKLEKAELNKFTHVPINKTGEI